MNSPDNYIKGECMEMCPQAEISLRENEKLLHILEILPGTEKYKKPVADKTKVVKSFSRSAAGKHMHDPKNLRPARVLLKTVNYLFQKVMLNNKVPWPITYDFIWDRLRSVRQDMVIQNISVAESICILQPIVRFYAYASYRLCNESIANFDPYINQTHLQECLKRLLCLYDDCDRLFINADSCKNSYCMKVLEGTRPNFEALYLILNLGSCTALTRALNLPKKWRKGIVRVAMTISLNYYRNNFVKVCSQIATLPLLLQAVATLHLPEIRRRALQIMSVAYSSKNLSFPLQVLRGIYLYENLDDVMSDCVYYGLKCTKSDVQFVKTDFDSSKNVVSPAHLSFIDEAFEKIEICDLILNG